MILNQAQKALRKRANKVKAIGAARFFKTAPGEYGYGDQFIGVTVPDTRLIANEFKDLSLNEIKVLLYSNIHEDRLLALIILVNQSIKAQKNRDIESVKKIARFYEKNWTQVNNWDLVDTSAKNILGPVYFQKSILPLLKMIRSKNMWIRRIGVLTTFYFIGKNDFQPTLYLCEKLLDDDQDLIHKATGWALREVGKKDEKVLLKFLDKFATKMPRTMLRYSIEKLSPIQMKHYMST